MKAVHKYKPGSLVRFSNDSKYISSVRGQVALVIRHVIFNDISVKYYVVLCGGKVWQHIDETSLIEEIS